jgi:hypothetical protein
VALPPPGPTGAPTAQRSGAHRPRRPVWHDAVPALVVVVLLAALVFGVFELRSTFDSGTTSSSGPLPPDDDNPPSATSTHTSTATKTHTSTSTTSPTSSATTTSGTVDKGLTISVYNATSRSGLAFGAAGVLRRAGWTSKVGGNETRFTPPGTTVYYGRAALKATAQAVEQSLDGPYRIHESATYGSGAVSVVLGSDYNS